MLPTRPRLAAIDSLARPRLAAIDAPHEAKASGNLEDVPVTYGYVRNLYACVELAMRVRLSQREPPRHPKRVPPLLRKEGSFLASAFRLRGWF